MSVCVCVGILYSEFLSVSDYEKVKKYAEVREGGRKGGRGKEGGRKGEIGKEGERDIKCSRQYVYVCKLCCIN